jgi:hypothetical protein
VAAAVGLGQRQQLRDDARSLFAVAWDAVQDSPEKLASLETNMSTILRKVDVVRKTASFCAIDI